jgi:RNA-binding protein Nova
MRGTGYSESVTNEVATALGILAKYGVLNVGVGVGLTNGTHSQPLNLFGVSAMEQNAANAAHAAAAAGGVYGAIGQVNLDSFIGTTSPTPRASLERYDHSTFDPFRHNSQAATPISLNNNTFGLATSASTAHAQAALSAAAVQQTLGALSNKSPTPGELGNKDIKNVEIPEVIVGAILGKCSQQLVGWGDQIFNKNILYISLSSLL